ncbi:MAG TPA: hypothetical protein PLM79_11545 [Syntrophobacteraceae bacterium]|nr:hypothetical protein [Syntrophobacteraceae bacterium]
MGTDVATILVFDEEQDSRTLIQRVLERGGHEVLACERVPRAEELASTRDPDLAVVHVGENWGGPGGIVSLLRAANRRLRVIIVADYDGRRGEECAANEILVPKPLDLETLESTVRSILLGTSEKRRSDF